MNWYWHLTLAQAVDDGAPPPPPGAPAPGQSVPGEIAPATGDGPATDTPATPGGSNFFFIMAIMLVVMWVMVFMPQRRERKRHANLLSALKKGDRVQTVGGVLGSVVEVRDSEVVLKVDETNNTRMHFARDSIRFVFSDSAEKK